MARHVHHRNNAEGRAQFRLGGAATDEQLRAGDHSAYGDRFASGGRKCFRIGREHCGGDLFPTEGHRTNVSAPQGR